MTLAGFRGIFVALALLGCVAGCSVPIAQDLSDHDANAVVAALQQQGISAEKLPAEGTEGRYKVDVPKEDAAVAIGVLQRENLPPAKAPGVLESLGKGSIVPSRMAEHAKLVTGTAGDLERSLRSIDGVLSARVHLAVTAPDPLAARETPLKPTASVLLRYRGATAPIAPAEVQRLVAGAVPELEAKDVAVVATASPAPSAAATTQLARVGPITATRGSVTTLKLVIGAAALLNLILIGLLLAVYGRSRRTVQELLELRSQNEGAQEPT